MSNAVLQTVTGNGTGEPIALLLLRNDFSEGVSPTIVPR